MYWSLRSRVNWLKWGDKNTKFFHATTIQLRSRNRITMLKGPNDEWLRGEEALKQRTVDYFRELFTTVGPRNFHPVLDQCPCIIQAEMNEGLTKVVTMGEVCEAVSQLGSTKAPEPDGLNGIFFKYHWEIIKWNVFFCCTVLFHWNSRSKDE